MVLDGPSVKAEQHSPVRVEELARRSGITATNISSLENKRVDIGKKRVEQLAKAFDVHPAIIMFPEYESKEIRKVA